MPHLPGFASFMNMHDIIAAPLELYMVQQCLNVL